MRKNKKEQAGRRNEENNKEEREERGEGRTRGREHNSREPSQSPPVKTTTHPSEYLLPPTS
jgi:hypothetical protein